MKNPNKHLRKAYFLLLQPLVNVPMWDKRIPPHIDEPDTYILFTDISKGEINRSKCDNMQNVAIQVDLIHKDRRGFADSARLDDLEEIVSEAIMPDVKTDIDLSPLFKCYNTFLDQNVDLPIETPTETILRRVLRFRHMIGEGGQAIPPPQTPIITIQPVGASLTEGDTLTLSITATSASIYQWYKGNVALAGQTQSTLQINNVSIFDAGIYKCIVSNSYGSVTSQNATVSVSIPGGSTILIPTTNLIPTTLLK